MVNEMSKLIYPYNAQILPSVWQLLTQTADVYVKILVNNSDPNAIQSTDDEELNNFSMLVLQLIEFINSIIEKKRFRESIMPVLTDLVYISIVYMQIAEEQIETWSDDAEAFVDDYNSENCECTIRVSSNDVLTNIADEFSSDVLLPSLSDALTRHVNVAEAEKDAGNPNWWKIVEASVAAVGSLKSFIVQPSNTKFNLKEYLMHVKQLLGAGSNGSGYQQDVSPFLHGKCLWLLCHYSDASVDIYDRQTLQQILDCVANNLHNQKPMVIQIGAMRALYELCTNLKESSVEQRAMVIDKLPGFVAFITDIVTRAKSNVLSELLMTIATVTEVISMFDCVVIWTVISNQDFSFVFFSLIRRSPPTTIHASFHLRLLFFSSILKIHSFSNKFKKSLKFCQKMNFASVHCKRNWFRRS